LLGPTVTQPGDCGVISKRPWPHQQLATALRSDEALAVMQKIPMRSFDPAIKEEPLIYRLVEVRASLVPQACRVAFV
jgi:hypothetical protein